MSTSSRTIHVAADGDDSGPGSSERPWASLTAAVEAAGPGDTVLVHDGTYALDRPLVVRRGGTADAWLELRAAPGHQPVLDASAIPVGPAVGDPPFAHDQGAVLVQDTAYVRIEGLTVRRSHAGGITVRDSHDVVVTNNTVDTTFGSGIAAWDTDHDDQSTHHIEISGNTIVDANRWSQRPPHLAHEEEGEAPHEAISLGGVLHFLVERNQIYRCEKEGIDIKETSKHGRVHGNLIHHVNRQGIYVDAWFGAIVDVEISHNVVHHCKGAGLVLSVENGKFVEDVQLHHNVVYENLGSGLFFSRWGDGPRRRVEVHHNTFVRNGYGEAAEDAEFYWLTGGVWLYSAQLSELTLRDNIIVDNAGFQIALSEHWRGGGDDLEGALRRRQVRVSNNLVSPSSLREPLRVGWPPDDWTTAYPILGEGMIEGPAPFVAPKAADFRLRAEHGLGEEPPGAL